MTADAQLGMRELNTRRVLHVLADAVALSRADIAQLTGLSRATVTSVVAELLRSGAIETAPRERVAAGAARPGRRAGLLSLRRQDGYALALDIAHESLRIALVGANGDIRTHSTTRLSGHLSPDAVTEQVGILVDRFAARAEIVLSGALGVVAAVPDPIDRMGNVARPDPSSRWDGRNPAALLSDRLGVPVVVENDANLAVIGEHLYGSARKMDDVIYVKVAHGVGTGILLNGTLVRGSDGLAGEVGHIQVRPDGRICSCGNRGCLFTLVTGPYLGPLLGDTLTGTEDLTALAVRNDAGARRLLKDAGYEVGKVLANLTNALNPAAVVVGGRFAHAGDSLVDGFRDAMERHAEPQVARSLIITRTALREGAELLGAAALASGVISSSRQGPRERGFPAAPSPGRAISSP